MVLTSDQQRIKTLLTETITLLCKNGLHYESEFSVEGLLGVTVDRQNVFLININETIVQQSSGPIITSSQSLSSTQEDTVPQQHEELKEVKRKSRRRKHSVSSSISISSSSSSSSLSFSRDPNVESKRFHYQLSTASHRDRSNSRDGSKISESQQHEPLIPRQSLVPIYQRPRHHGRHRHLSRQETTHTAELPERHLSGVKQEPTNSVGEMLLEQANSSSYFNMSATEFQPQQQDADLFLDSTVAALSSRYSTSSLTEASTSTQQGVMSGGEVRPTGMPAVAAMALSSVYNKSQRPPVHINGPNSYQCTICGKTMTTSFGISQHFKSIHCSIYSYFCPQCSKGYNSIRDLRGHMACKHNMQKEFRCLTCGREFAYKRSLKEHVCLAS